MYKAKIFVNYKPSVLDPKAQVIQNTLTRLGDDAREPLLLVSVETRVIVQVMAVERG